MTISALHFLVPPFVMCLLLIGIHCYLGLHVLAREVIFVDLSLAQVAGLGATLALFIGFDHHSNASYIIALLSTFIAGGLFALSRSYSNKISQEAIIGIVYAMASASIVLVIDKMAHGTEHIKDLMIGQILWVTWDDIVKTSFIYAFAALIHYLFRKQLINASFHGSGARTFFWDFVFYALFGLVITSSVHIAGVLQVFAYLIVPAVLSTFFYSTIRARMLFGWIVGSLLSVVALYLSHLWDLPAGAVLVVVFTAVPIFLLICLATINILKGSKNARK